MSIIILLINCLNILYFSIVKDFMGLSHYLFEILIKPNICVFVLIVSLIRFFQSNLTPCLCTYFSILLIIQLKISISDIYIFLFNYVQQYMNNIV